jgi:kynurenine formamidase
MTRFIDLSHDFFDGMPGSMISNADGQPITCTARIWPFLTRERSAPLYDGKASFELTEIHFQTSIGTYLDSPYVRYAEGRNIAALHLDDLILPGHVVDVRGRKGGDGVALSELTLPDDLSGSAVLFAFGWDAFWGTDAYKSYPFIGADLVDALIARGVKLVGVDTGNMDDFRDPVRPAHTRFLKNEVLIVENLRNLAALHGAAFRFFALPIKARRTGSMPVRAFAEVIEAEGGANA